MARQSRSAPALPDTDERKVPLVFRVGITGTRMVPVDPQQVDPAINAAIEGVLRTIIDTMAAVRDDPLAQRCYRSDPLPLLRCLSPLAEGADQVFAQIALDQHGYAQARNVGVCLESVIPFDRADYMATFSKDRAAALTANFDRLAAQAECGVLQLDGDAADDVVRPLSYQATGEVVVRNVDLMIALWDEHASPKGRGGSRDTVLFALKSGVPVWRVDPAGKLPPRLLDDQVDLWGSEPHDTSHARLSQYLDTVLLPPGLHDDEPHLDTGIVRYLEEPLRLNFNFSLLHSGIIGNFRHYARNRKIARRSPGEPRPKKWHFCKTIFMPFGRGRISQARIASQLAAAYQHRYRSTYLLVLIGGIVALSCSVAGLAKHSGSDWTSAVELVSLFAILGVASANWLGGWHERYISYRLLSEMARAGPLLNTLGWSLPFARMRRVSQFEGLDWTAWLASAQVRALPMSAGVLRDNLHTMRDEIATNFISRQIDFHADRRSECAGAARWLTILGLFTFLATLALVVVKALLELRSVQIALMPLLGERCIEHLAKIISAVTIASPTISASFFALNAYEEFETLAEMSRKMGIELDQVCKRIFAIDLDHPLASQVLAKELLNASSLMLSEVNGWSELILSRSVEL